MAIFIFVLLAVGFLFCLDTTKKMGPPGHPFQYGSYKRALQNTPWLRVYHAGLAAYFLVLILAAIMQKIISMSSIY